MEAKKRQKEGWIFTLHYPSYVPFMQYSERRDLRELMFKAYSSRAFRNNDFDNRNNVKRIVKLRLEIAKILGYNNYAEMTLGDRMADSPSKVIKFLDELYAASKPAAIRDYDTVMDFAKELGHQGVLERWDWAYYSEKLKMKKYNIDDEVLKPYFSLDKVQNAIFSLAGRLYGLRFIENNSIPLYHKEVKTMEVLDEDGYSSGNSLP